MNRLTAIGLASLVAYGLLIASKYTGLVSAAGDEKPPIAAAPSEERPALARVEPMRPEPQPQAFQMPVQPRRTDTVRISAVALDFRASRDLKTFVDGLAARRASLTSDERYHLAKALEECQFATSINEDLAAYSAKQRRQFLASLPAGEANNAKRIAAYDAVDNTHRCIGFQNAKIAPRDIDELYRAAALQGDARAQARILTAELSKNGQRPAEPGQQASNAQGDQISHLIGLLESRDPEAMLIVGEFLARSAQQIGLRVGPNGEVPEPSAFLGGFSLVACDLGQDCSQLHREPQMACAYAGYCNAGSFEELYQNFVASPWAYSQAIRYRGLIHTAIQTQNWGLIGLTPPVVNRAAGNAQ